MSDVGCMSQMTANALDGSINSQYYLCKKKNIFFDHIECIQRTTMILSIFEY